MTKPPMGTTGRGDELAAELLADLQRDAVMTVMPTGRVPEPAETSPSLQTTLRITPRFWRMPGLRRRTGGFTGSLGPLEVALTLSGRVR